MENLFPTITGAHWKKAIERAMMEPNKIRLQIKEIIASKPANPK